MPNKFRDLQFQRDVHSSPALKNTATLGKAEEKEPESLIAKYGSIPFFGMFATVLVTKELYLIDAEFLLGLETILFFTTLYVGIGDTHQKWCDAEDAKVIKQFEESHDFVLENVHQYKLKQEALLNKPAVMEEYLKEYETSVKAHAAFKTVLPKHEARAKLLATLQSIKTKEDLASAAEWQETVDKAVGNVAAALSKADAKLKEELIESAIKCMNMSETEVEPLAVETDPVKKLFLAQF